jgi:hypothetical protein
MSGARQVNLPIEIGGNRIDIIVSTYSDRVFIVITELPGFGMLINAAAEIFPDGSVEYNITTLLGDREEELLTLLARRLIEIIHRDTALPMLLSVALQSPSEGIIRALLSHLEEKRVWVVGDPAGA